MTAYIGGNPRTRNESWLRFIGMQGLWEMLGYGYWIFADRQNDTLIGVGGLASFERGLAELDGVPEAGWAMAPDHWGKGLVSEAMGAVMAWSDNVLYAPIVRCIIDPGHVASERVASRLGFVQIGTGELAAHPINVYGRPRPLE